MDSTLIKLLTEAIGEQSTALRAGLYLTPPFLLLMPVITFTYPPWVIMTLVILDILKVEAIIGRLVLILIITLTTYTSIK